MENVVRGFAFENADDAALAEAERKKIEYLKKHMDNGKPETVMALYNKAIQERLFKTPVGIEFLRELQTYLIEQADYAPEEVRPIPLHVSFESPRLRDHTETTKQRIAPKKEPKPKVQPIFISVVLNIALVIGVLVMFWIALTSDQPNIINYEKSLQNLYSDWDQQLTLREQAVREKELQLGIETQTTH